MKRVLQWIPYLSWVAVVMALLVARPTPGSPSFVLLVGVALVLGAAMTLRTHLENRADKRAFELWQARLRTLAPVMDVDDDGHLHEWLDPPQWEAVFAALEQTPRESRSLREAMEAVEPDITT
jgi:hypothetical protein